MTKLKESGQPWLTTDPIVVEHIIPLFRQLDKLERWIRENEYASHISLNEFLHLHHEVAGFLEGIHFIDKCREIADHTASHEAFQKRFFRYFNAFMMIRYTHALTRSAYPEIPVTLAARTLAARLNIQGSDDADTEKLLDIYRHLDHYHAAVPK
jgi:hypothetical protein